MGIMLSGCVMFPISPRNSAAAVAHLLAKTGAHHIFVSPDNAMQSLISTAMESATEDVRVSVHTTPTFEVLFPGCDEDLRDAGFVAPRRSQSDIAAIYHSSGWYLLQIY